MRPEDRVRLAHMIEAAETVGAFVAGRQRDDLDHDRMLSFALMRAVEVIGEAASRMSAQARDAAPAVPWTQVIGMRNRLVHAYFDVDHDILWRTAVEEVPGLLELLRPLLHDGCSGR